MKGWTMTRLLGLAGVMIILTGMLAGCYYKQDYDDAAGPPGNGVQGPRLIATVQPRYVPANGSATAVVQVRLIELDDGTGIANQEVLLRIEGVDPELMHFADGTNTMTVFTDGTGTAYATLFVGAFDPDESPGADGIDATIRADTVLRFFDDWTNLSTWTLVTIYDPNVDY